jgi:DNA-binding transcriptional ArsR family regulator
MTETSTDADRCELLCLDLERAERLRAELPDAESIELQAQAAKAVADPTRMMVARVLAAADELCVCDLSWILGRSENLVSHHLKILRTEGLAASRRDGKMVMYSLSDRGRALLDAVAAAQLVA